MQTSTNIEEAESAARRDDSGHAYRPEIDGLRAVAVVAVLLFHLDADWLPGGFVGVDVFFVISGYLITGYVRRGAADGTWRYPAFFLRRVRRLAPPLLVTTACACLAGSFLLPSQLVPFAESVIAQPIALQNMYFLVDGEYFQGSDAKPLLHTWSLGVEEQFYLVWPPLVILASRLPRRISVAVIGAMLVLSFGLCLALPLVSPKAAFFSLPARAWELGVGGVLAVVEESSRPARRSAWLRGGVGGAALAVLAACFCLIDSSMVFPGWIAAIPVFATAASIAAFSRGDSVPKRWLSTPAAVSIGLMSYSLYLWHWPVIVFFRFAGADARDPLTAGAVVIASSLCAFLSYRWVEQPIRRRTILRSDRALVACCMSTGLVLMAFGVAAVRTDGFAFRYDEPARSMLTASFDVAGDERCGFAFRALYPTAQVCQLNDVPASTDGVLLWGNSHAGMWSGVMGRMATEAGRPFYLNARNCRATTDSDFCDAHVQERVLSSIVTDGIDDVILAASWYGAYEIPDEELEQELEEVVAAIASREARVWLVVDVPVDESFSPEARYLADPDHPSLGTLRADVHEARRARELGLFGRIAATVPNVRILDPTDAFCTDQFCFGGRDGRTYYRDASHITETGAEAARHSFLQVFSR